MNRFGEDEDWDAYFSLQEEDIEDVYEVTEAKKKEMIEIKAANNRAAKNPVEFSLTPNSIVFPLTCPVLGFPLAYKAVRKGRSEATPTFDRLDPTKGYTPENTRIISWRANRIKNDGTAEEHLLIAEYIRRNQKP